MKAKYVIGIDISKSKIDCAVMDFNYKIIQTKVVVNNTKAISAFLSTFLEKRKLDKEEVVVCCENTGIYNRPLEVVCIHLGIKLWVEHAIKIKRASTDMRGKDDKKDSIRIAEYCVRYFDKFIVYEEPSEVVQKLHVLVKSRGTLIEQRVAINNQLVEAEKMDSFEYKILKSTFNASLKTINKSILKLEQQIEELIESVPEIKKNRDLLLSIKGIGKQCAIAIIIVTDNFKRFKDPKHLACYIGVVPFKNESGVIIKRARISKMAHRNLKRLFHLAAMAAIRFDEELKAYYQRKVSEGKNKMSVINAVRNKLVHRVMAVINRQTPFLTEKEFLLKKETKIVAF